MWAAQNNPRSPKYFGLLNPIQSRTHPRPINNPAYGTVTSRFEIKLGCPKERECMEKNTGKEERREGSMA